MTVTLDTQANVQFGNYENNPSMVVASAGFNAYMTGHIFANLTKKIEIDQSSKSTSI